MRKDMMVEVRVGLSDLADYITQEACTGPYGTHGYESIIEFIREMDSQLMDSVFTEMLYNLATELKANLER